MKRTEEPKTKDDVVTVLLEGRYDWVRLGNRYGDGGTEALTLDSTLESLATIIKETANRLKLQNDADVSVHMDMPTNLRKDQIEFLAAVVGDGEKYDYCEVMLAAGWLWDRYAEWLFDNFDQFKTPYTTRGTAELMAYIIEKAWKPAQLLISGHKAEYYEF